MLRHVHHVRYVGGTSIITFIPSSGLACLVVFDFFGKEHLLFLLLVGTLRVAASTSVVTVAVKHRRAHRSCLLLFGVDHGLDFREVELLIIFGIYIFSIMAVPAAVATMLFIYLILI